MESFYKLQPDTDLQVYFEQPTAIAALSRATAHSFHLSGEWRQQTDWAVVEWNRDNPIDHPLWRNLPDGDLSGLTLSYEERRTNCIPIDSTFYPTVDWDHLRVWTESRGVHQFHKVSVMPDAQAIGGSFQPAACAFTLTGTPVAGDFVGLSWHTEHRTHQCLALDTPNTIVQALADSFNAFPGGIEATPNGNTLELRYVGFPSAPDYRHPGANGNRVGIYSYAKGLGTLAWDKSHALMAGGSSPDLWRVTLPFATVSGQNGEPIDWEHVRKLRWTYAAPVSYEEFARQEFLVEVSNWTVTGTGRVYSFPGTGSRRIEDDARSVEYLGTWSHAKGNFSGGSIHWTSEDNAEVLCKYFHPLSHRLFLGSRAHSEGGGITVSIDGESLNSDNLRVSGEDSLVRRHLASLPAGSHEVRLRNAAGGSGIFYFDFLEIAHLQTGFPSLPADTQLSLSTDWDTDHSLSIPAERTAALITRLGFGGRVNHYVGAMWFYQLRNKGYTCSETSITFEGTPEFGASTELRIGNSDYGPEFDTVFTHLNRVADSAESIAMAFALRINEGSTAVRAEASGAMLRIVARRLGSDGNKITVVATPNAGAFFAMVASTSLAGGINGEWVTDVSASPKLNRAMRDWHRSFFAALAASGVDCVTAYSTELRHGDRSPSEGIAQRYWDQSPVELNTPAVQTNFSSTSLAFWREVHRESAQLMADAGLVPYLQFGEVQYWYFPNASGMPFYDEDAMQAFFSRHGRAMAQILDQFQPPALYQDEIGFLRERLGTFTDAIIHHVRATLPATRFEVLYPPDVNDSAIAREVNFPDAAWSPTRLDCLKTESFTHTLASDLNKSRATIAFSAGKGFPAERRAHLVGISDHASSWQKELRWAASERLESVTLFALDQMCLIGYRVPFEKLRATSRYQG